MACSVTGFFQSSRKQSVFQKLINWICILKTDWICEVNKNLDSLENMYQGYYPEDNHNNFYLSPPYQLHPHHVPYPNGNYNFRVPANQNFRPRPNLAGGNRYRPYHHRYSNSASVEQPAYYQEVEIDEGSRDDPNYMSFSNPSQSRKRKTNDNERNKNEISSKSKKAKEDYVLKIPPTPKISSNSEITQAMIEYFVKHHQTEEMYLKKVKLRDALYNILNGVLTQSGLFIVGSSMSGCGTMTSDMDLCLMLTDYEVDQTKEAPDLLYMIQRSFQKCSFLNSCMVIRAKVPILRFTDTISKIECDLNINNRVGIRNTHLIKYYCMLDWRVRPLMLYIKMWSRFHDINDARKMTISSYSLCLMVIHYLQFSCKPPVLPSLQALYPDIFHSKSDVRALRFDHQLKYSSKNEQTLGDLFLGFLEYYTNNFDFMNQVISVRTGSRTEKWIAQGQVDDGKQWKFLNIEEPFDLTNTSRSCYDQHTFERVKRVIRLSYQKLSRSRDVKTILSQPF